MKRILSVFLSLLILLTGIGISSPVQAESVSEQIAALQEEITALEAQLKEGVIGFYRQNGTYDDIIGMINRGNELAEAELGHVVTEIGNANDATSFEHVLKALDLIEEGNQLRAADEHRQANHDGNSDALLVSDRLMALAQIQTNYTAYVFAHWDSLKEAGYFYYTGENIAAASYAAYDPFEGWYTDEKLAYDTYLADHPDADAKRFYDEAIAYYKEKYQAEIAAKTKPDVRSIGHYTNLINPLNETNTRKANLTGLAVSTYAGNGFAYTFGQEFGRSDYPTGIQNGATPISTYGTTYTVSEYRSALQSYINGLNNRLSEAKAELEELQSAGTEGEAYAILTGEGELIFFRDTETYTNGNTYTVTINNANYTGTVYTGVESTADAPAGVPWADAMSSIVSARVADGQTIAPASMAFWFSGAGSLTYFNAAGIDGSAMTAFRSAFSGCSALTELDLSSLDTSKVTDMNGLFARMTSLQTIDLSGSFSTASCTDLSVLFSNDTALTEIDLSNFDTSKVTTMEGMFNFCENLQSLDLGSFRTPVLQRTGSMFQYCSKLTSLNVSTLDTSQVRNMSNMFLGCSSLTELDIANFDTGSVVNAGYMLNGCYGLQTIVLGPQMTILADSGFNDQVPRQTAWLKGELLKTTQQLKEGYADHAAEWAGTWQKVAIPTDVTTGFSGATVYKGQTNQQNLSYTPADVVYGREVTWTSADESIVTVDENGVLTGVNYGTAIVTVTLNINPNVSQRITVTVPRPESYAVLTDQGEFVFFQADAHYTGSTGTFTDIMGNEYTGTLFTDVEVDRSSGTVTSWYDHREDILSVRVAEGQSVAPKTMHDWFLGAVNLTSADLRGLDTSAVKDMSGLFSTCSSLTEVHMEGLDTSAVTNISSLFNSCTALETADLRVFAGAALTSMASVFSNCTALQSVDLTGLDTSSVTSMNALFGSCSSLAEIDLSMFRTDSLKNMYGMFSGCSSLTELDLSNFNTSQVTRMGNLFANCSALTSLTLGESFLNMTSEVALPGTSWQHASSGLIKTAAELTNGYSANAAEWAGTWRILKAITSLELDEYELNILIGQQAELTVSYLPEDASYPVFKWTSSDENVATVDQNGKVTAVGEGETMIRVEAQDGSGKYDLCRVNGRVPVEEIVLTSSSYLLRVGDTTPVLKEILPANAYNIALRWESSNTNVATVDGFGEVTAVGLGEATITAYAEDGSGKEASCTVRVYKPVTSITLSTDHIDLFVGQTETLSATVQPEDATFMDVVFKSYNEDVATVDQNGKITAVGSGYAQIDAYSEKDPNARDRCMVRVTQPVTSIILSPAATNTHVGQTVRVDFSVLPEDADERMLEWTSSDENVVTVNRYAYGENTYIELQAVGNGTATITASAMDGSGVSESFDVTVTILISRIVLDPETLTLQAGENGGPNVFIFPESASDTSLTWTSSDTNIATVDETGTISALKAGEVTITATAKDGSGVTANCYVTVEAVPVTEIRLDQEALTLEKGEQVKLNATVLPENATDKTVSYHSDNTEAVTVDSNGNIRAVSVGSARITVSADDDSGIQATCTVTVTDPTIFVSSLTLNKTSLTLETGKSEILQATVTPSDATDKSVDWSSSNTSVATVDQSGKVTAKAAGTAVITVTAKDGSGKSASCTVTVKAANIPVSSLKLNKSSLTLSYGKSTSLTVTVFPSDATNKKVSWKSSDPSVVTVDNNGKITAKAVGTATITVTSSDGSKKSASCKVTVEPVKPVLTATYNSSKGADIRWKPQEGVETYYIMQKYGGSWNMIKEVNVSQLNKVGGSLQYIDESVRTTYGKGYIYSVAVMKNGKLLYDTKGLPLYRLRQPTFTSITAKGNGVVEVNWTKENCQGYEVQYSSNNGASWQKAKQITSGSVTTQTIDGLSKGTTYVFRIRCQKTNKARGTTWSQFSAWKKCVVK